MVEPIQKDFNAALQYHEDTKHSETSIRASQRRLDWANKPNPFKTYQNIPSITLPNNFPHPSLGALTSIAATEPTKPATELKIGGLAELLFFTGGITRRMKLPNAVHFMRAAPATGALYPIELYVINQDLEGLKGGVYHFSPQNFTLQELRRGDYRAQLAAWAGNNETIASSPLTIAMTSIAWRNAWKYEARSYRHWFWDSGVMAANLLATAVSAGYPIQLILGFDDVEVNYLLCLNEGEEATVALASIGAKLSAQSNVKPGPATEFHLVSDPLSREKVEYSEIWRIQEASSLSGGQVSSWVNSGLSFERRALSQSGRLHPLPHSSEVESKDSLEQVILRRGSTRRFAVKPISLLDLSVILHCSSQGVPFDFLRAGGSLVDVYLIVSAVEGLAPGAYFLHRKGNTLEELKLGSFRDVSGFLCLEQRLFSDASAVLFLMADLESILRTYGNRGYRVAQFEAGVVLGKIYLSAYALKLGASGSTFYDDAVTEFFSPHAERKQTLVAAGIGVPDYEARSGKVLIEDLSRQK